MSTLLSTQNLSFHNNHGILLSNISLALTKGEKIGLIGYNGCGKSTLLKLLSHQLIPTDGSTKAYVTGSMASRNRDLKAAT